MFGYPPKKSISEQNPIWFVLLAVVAVLDGAFEVNRALSQSFVDERGMRGLGVSAMALVVAAYWFSCWWKARRVRLKQEGESESADLPDDANGVSDSFEGEAARGKVAEGEESNFPFVSLIFAVAMAIAWIGGLAVSEGGSLVIVFSFLLFLTSTVRFAYALVKWMRCRRGEGGSPPEE